MQTPLLCPPDHSPGQTKVESDEAGYLAYQTHAPSTGTHLLFPAIMTEDSPAFIARVCSLPKVTLSLLLYCAEDELEYLDHRSKDFVLVSSELPALLSHLAEPCQQLAPRNIFSPTTNRGHAIGEAVVLIP